MMIKVDLSQAAAVEVDRLTQARTLAVRAADPQLSDQPLIAIARRLETRKALRGRTLLLWRLAYEDPSGRVVESTLVALTIRAPGPRLDLRRTSWSNDLLLTLVAAQSGDWRESAQRTVRQFTSTRLARERAIADSCTEAGTAFQAGLFDRRADRAHAARTLGSTALREQLVLRTKAVMSSGSISLRSPELLLVLIPRDAAGL